MIGDKQHLSPTHLGSLRVTITYQKISELSLKPCSSFFWRNFQKSTKSNVCWGQSFFFLLYLGWSLNFSKKEIYTSSELQPRRPELHCRRCQDWTPCSVTCGLGYHNRQRIVATPKSGQSGHQGCGEAISYTLRVYSCIYIYIYVYTYTYSIYIHINADQQ